MTHPPLYHFVKASERLPEEPFADFVWYYSNLPKEPRVSNGYHLMDLHDNGYEIEWLEAYTPPPDNRDAVAFAEWLRKHNDIVAENDGWMIGYSFHTTADLYQLFLSTLAQNRNNSSI